MSPPSAAPQRLDRVDADLVAVRERLARLEERMDAHDRASAERHRELVGALEEVADRMKQVESRGWRMAMGLAVLGAGGGAGGAQLVQALLGG